MRVYVETPTHNLVGQVVKAEIIENGLFDLDMPFTVKDEDSGELIRVTCPWNCYVRVLEDDA